MRGILARRQDAARADYLGGGPHARTEKKIAERVTRALVEDGRAKLENIHVAFLDVPATDYAEAGVTVADQKRSP
jgi:phenylpyruvate tautomerase PptA (4-oxalocrotonate tautomerase family)